jgi:BirA family transcriptional regulator, biotin operon repressor / biotin---[acetyl-CoA-carboxylase] ligase
MSPRLHRFDRLHSTMDLVHELAAQGAEAGTAVLAGEQLLGRGSRGRSWHSPVGGLWLSVLFRPPDTGALEVMSLRVGLAVAEALDSLLPHSLQLKWPNDLMLGERKVGGILCEARWQGHTLAWVTAGVGLNVRNPVADDLLDLATTLSSELPAITVDEVVDPVLAGLRGLDLGSEGLTADEVQRFAMRDWLRGREIRSPAAGRVSAVRGDGALMVQPPDGIEVAVRSGTVELAAVSPIR